MAGSGKPRKLDYETLRTWDNLGHVERLFWKQGGKCFYCERDMFLYGSEKHKLFCTCDHRVPRCRGGSNDKKNVVACCNGCNQRKGHLTDIEFAAVAEACGSYLTVPKQIKQIMNLLGEDHPFFKQIDMAVQSLHNKQNQKQEREKPTDAEASFQDTQVA